MNICVCTYVAFTMYIVHIFIYIHQTTNNLYSDYFLYKIGKDKFYFLIIDKGIIN